MTRPRGRPAKDMAAPARQTMLAMALELLDAKGVEPFTMRAVAAHLRVNAMTIYHHFGDRDGLIAAMADHAYADVSAPEAGHPLDRIAALMLAYHARVLRHPSLALLVFRGGKSFPAQARRITDDLSNLLADTGLTARKRRLWLAILVDFTHGAAIATATGGQSAPALQDPDPYEDALAEVLGGLQASLASG